MRHLKNILIMAIICFVVSIAQYFITGFYGRPVFCIALALSLCYYLKHNIRFSPMFYGKKAIRKYKIVKKD